MDSYKIIDLHKEYRVTIPSSHLSHSGAQFGTPPEYRLSRPGILRGFIQTFKVNGGTVTTMRPRRFPQHPFYFMIHCHDITERYAL